MGAILPAAACRRSTHPKQSCEGRATGFQPSDLFSHSFICSEASAGSHMGRDSYISVNGCSLSCEILRPKVSRARSESLRLSALRNIWKRLTPYGPITRIRKPPACFIPSIFFPLGTVQPVPLCRTHTRTPQDCSCSGAEHQGRQDQGRSKHQLGDLLLPGTAQGETKEAVEKPLFAVPDEMKCYCPLRLSQCSAVQTQLLLHPQQCFVPVSAQGLFSLLPLILHCHTIHRNCSSQTSEPHIEQTRTKSLHSPPRNKGKVWREERLQLVF